MALLRPTLLNISPFDATKPATFTFTAGSGGSAINSNTLTIKRNDTLATVYSATQATALYQHTVPAGTLSNGLNYIATIITNGENGLKSVESRPISFYCFVTPTFEFTNIPVGNIINNNSFEFNLLYTQVNMEPLNTVTFNLYSTTGAILSTSGAINDFTPVPNNVRYLFSGFNNKTEYYVEAVGQTLHGMNLSTGQIRIEVNYDAAGVYSLLSLSNNCNGGYIQIQSSVVAIDGISNPSPAIYIDNEKIDLRADGSWVEFNDGYEITSDFAIKLWGQNFTANSTILNMGLKDGGNIQLKYIDGVATYIRLIVTDGEVKYIAESNAVPRPSADMELFILLRRIDNLYQITLAIGG